MPKAINAKPLYVRRAVNMNPIAEINITPLIDVMLVLLVMIILTVPILTHKVSIDLPTAGAPIVGTVQPVHVLEINNANQLFWDGVVVSGEELDAKLAGFIIDPQKPQLHMRSAPTAKYDIFDKTIAKIKKAGVGNLGFIGNQKYAEWK